MNEQNNSLPILRTKLYPPPLTTDHVTRGRLLAEMDRALHVPLTLVCAPAGYGKSVLVSEWARAQKRAVAWLSLDETDGDLRQFLSCLASAIEDLAPNVCRDIRDQLSAHELAPLRSLAYRFVNQLDELDDSCFIVLDDLHRLERGSRALDFLSIVLDHPPPSLHLIILTRRDPQLPLNKLRVRNSLAEIRVLDLCFSSEESTAFIGKIVDRHLTTAALEHLNDEVEGWAAGLRLVALALKNASDPNQLLIALHGGIQQTQVYMMNEVVTGLSPQIQHCLMQSSILDQFDADLISAVCIPGNDDESSRIGGHGFLEFLQRNNIFTVSLDSQGEWFRYHHWFQGMLRRHLKRNFSVDDIRKLHTRAARWFEANDQITNAIRHLLAADNVDAAASLVLLRVRDEIEKDQWFVIERWLDLLPEDVQNDRPEMQLARAWVGFCQLNTALVLASVNRLEALLAGVTIPGEMAPDIHFLRGWLAFWNSDMGLAKTHLAAAIEAFGLSPGMIAGELRLYLAFAKGMSGDYPGAVRFLEAERVKAGDAAGVSYKLRVIGGQSHLHLLFGNIRAAIQAMDIFNATNANTGNNYAVCWDGYLHGLQYWQLYDRERSLGFFESASDHLNMIERRAAIDLLACRCLAQQSLQRVDGADETLGELADLAVDFGDVEYRQAAASCGARVELMRGNAKAALAWARTASVQETDPIELFVWGEKPIVTRARVLVVAGEERDVAEGLAQLDELYAQIQPYGIVCQLIDVQLLRVLALSKLGDSNRAMSILNEMLPTAVNGGWVRPFVELGQPMSALLSQLDVNGAEREFIQRVTEYVERPPRGLESVSSAIPQVARPEVDAGGALGPEGLTNRELDILDFLEQRLQNKEIARKLHISPHTVGYHLKHIYQKLGVHGRRQAIAIARETGVLPAR